MFLKRHASKLLGVESTKFLLSVDLLELQVDTKHVPEPRQLVEGCTFTVSLEKRARSSSSAKKELRYVRDGVNPMSKLDPSAVLPSIVALQDRLQMVITLYSDPKRFGGYQAKTATIKLKVVKPDPVVGVDVLVTVASQTLRIHDLAPSISGSRDHMDMNCAAIGHELSLALDGLPNSCLRVSATLIPIGAEGTEDDAKSISSKDSDVGFEYDDMTESTVIAADTPPDNKYANGTRRSSHTIARRSSYLADDVIAHPAQRRRSLLVQRAKSHLTSLFTQIHEDDKDKDQDAIQPEDTLGLLDEARQSLMASPLGNSPAMVHRSRLSSRDTPKQRGRKRIAGRPSGSQWVQAVFRLSAQQMASQRTSILQLQVDLEAAQSTHTAALEQKQREIEMLYHQLALMQDKHDAAVAEAAAKQQQVQLMQQKEEERARVAEETTTATLPPDPPTAVEVPAASHAVEEVAAAIALDSPREGKEEPETEPAAGPARHAEPAVVKDMADASTNSNAVLTVDASTSSDITQMIDMGTDCEDLLPAVVAAAAADLTDFRLPDEVMNQLGLDDEDEDEDEEMDQHVNMRQSFLIAPAKTRNSMLLAELDQNGLCHLDLMREELAASQNKLCVYEAEQAEMRNALRDAANKIVESCVKRAELEWELEDCLRELAESHEMNGQLLEDLDAAKKKNLFASQKVRHYKEEYTKMEVKYRESMLPPDHQLSVKARTNI